MFGLKDNFQSCEETENNRRFEFYFEEKVMKHEQLTRDELIELVRKIIDCDGNEETRW